MSIAGTSKSLLLSFILLYSGHIISSLSYDHYATTECLVEPQKPQYGGGIIANPEFNNKIEGWTAFGHGAIEARTSNTGNNFIAVHSRTYPLDSLSQRVHLQKGNVYTFSAWVQTSEGSETIVVVFKTGVGKLIHGGSVKAKKGCWSLLKGGLVANFSSPVDILFKNKNTKVDIWVDSVSLQPFTKQQWRSHQYISISKIRKSMVRFQISSENKAELRAAKVSIKQTKSGFPFGFGINSYIVNSTDYQKWCISRSTVVTFTNEMKWYSTEKKQGQENYTVADEMLAFAEKNGISVRGHCIFWDNPKYQPDWVKSLSPEELKNASAKRINSVLSRYAGKLIQWDVVNENMHFSFFEDKLGKNASAAFYATAHKLDPNTTMFLNEYNTIEYSDDEAADPLKFLKKIQEIKSLKGNEELIVGIGLQGHFGSGQPNLAYMRAGLDLLGSTGLPIWLTEVSVDKDPNQAEYVEEILREGYSHPAVEGIVSFSGPEAAGFKDMPLTYMNFTNTPSGDAIDNLLKEWKSGTLEVTTNMTGSLEMSLFHGEYSFTVQNPVTDSLTSLNFTVKKDHRQEPIGFLI